MMTEDAPSRSTVIAFTSGGPLGVIVQSALAASVATALELSWRVRNASVATLLFHGARCVSIASTTPRISTKICSSRFVETNRLLSCFNSDRFGRSFRRPLEGLKKGSPVRSRRGPATVSGKRLLNTPLGSLHELGKARGSDEGAILLKP